MHNPVSSNTQSGFDQTDSAYLNQAKPGLFKKNLLVLFLKADKSAPNPFLKGSLMEDIMNAIKSIYKNAPTSIPVPEEFQKKNIEVIFLPIEDEKKATDISKFFGALPDFPERAPQEQHQKRENF